MPNDPLAPGGPPPPIPVKFQPQKQDIAPVLQQIEKRGFTYWQSPIAVARYYHAMQAAPPDWQPPPWMDREGITAAYEYMKFRNNNAPWQEWKYLHPEDPAVPFLSNMQTPPKGFDSLYEGANVPPAYYQPPAPDQPEVPQLSNVGAWENLSKDEQLLVSLFYPGQTGDLPGRPEISRITGALGQGALAGLGGAAVGGLIGSAAAGVGAGPGSVAGFVALGGLATANALMSTYTGKSIPVADQILRLFDLAAVGAEIGIGLGAQAKTEGGWENVLENLPEAAKAGELKYETMDTDIVNWYKQVVGAITGKTEQAGPDQVWQLQKGISDPVALQGGVRGGEALVEARERMVAGEDPQLVFADYIERFGFTGTFNDFMAQSILDPLNLAPWGAGKTGQAVGKMTGNVRLTRAAELATGNPLIDVLPFGVQQLVEGGGRTLFQNTKLAKYFTSSSGLLGMKETYKNLIRTGFTPEGQEITAAAGLSAQEKRIAGLTDAGELAELQPGNPKGFIRNMAELKPESKGHIFHSILLDNVFNLIALAEDNPETMVSLIKQAGAVDPVKVGQVGESVLKSPETATVAVAYRDWIKSGKPDEMLNNWLATAEKNTILIKMAQVLGEAPGKFLESLENSTDATFERLRKAAQLSNQANILAAMDSGQLTPQGLKDTLGVFMGKDALPWHPDEFAASMVESLGKHTGDFLVERFNISKDGWVIRLADTLKVAQSLLLLGLNPAYFVNNAVNNVVTRAAQGVFGQLTPGNIKRWYDRWGYEPARVGVGIGAAEAGSKIDASAIAKATEVKDLMGNANRSLRGMNRSLGIFSHASSAFESAESKQAYTIGIQNAWNKLWRRGDGFRNMPPALTQLLNDIDPRLTQDIYAAIEAGMNMEEISKAVYATRYKPQLNEVIDRAASALFPNSPDIGTQMIKATGIDATLESKLANAETPAQIEQAFNEMESEIQEYVDMLAGQELQTRVDDVASRLKGEGFSAIYDIFADVEMAKYQQDAQHWTGAQEVFDNKASMTKAQATAYIRSWMESERQAYNRANAFELNSYKGIIQAIGMDSTPAKGFINGIAEKHTNWRNFYEGYDEKGVHVDGRNDLYRKFFDKYSDREKYTFEQRQGAWEALLDDVNRLYIDALAKEKQAQIKLNDIFVKMWEEFTGQPAEDARNWRQGVMGLRDQMAEAMQAFRDQLRRGKFDDTQRRQMWRDFLQETYLPLVAEMKNAELLGAAVLAKTQGKPPVTPPDLPPVKAGEVAGAAEAINTETVNRPAMATDMPDLDDWLKAQGYNHQQHALNSVNKWLGTKYEKFEDITATDLKEGTKKWRGEHGLPPELVDVQAHANATSIMDEADALASEAKVKSDTIMTRRTLQEKLRQFAQLSADQVKAVMLLFELRAQRWAEQTGQPKDAWYARLADMADGEAGLAQADGLYQGEKGSYHLLQDGKAVITAFKSADFSTFIHEIGHVFRRDLAGDDLEAVAQWGGLKDAAELQMLERAFLDGTISEADKTRYVDAEEQFARGFERYLAEDNEAIPPKMQSVFKKFAQWLKEIYGKVFKGTPLDVDITATIDVNGKQVNIKEVFDRLLFDDEMLNYRKNKAEIIKTRPKGDATVEGGNVYEYKVVEASDLIHKGDEAYPRGVTAGEVAPPAEISPASLETALETPPVIDSDGVVEGDTGESVRVAVDAYPEQAEAYKSELESKLPEYGLPDTALDGIENPVLVKQKVDEGVATSDENITALAEEEGVTVEPAAEVEPVAEAVTAEVEAEAPPPEIGKPISDKYYIRNENGYQEVKGKKLVVPGYEDVDMFVHGTGKEKAISEGVAGLNVAVIVTMYDYIKPKADASLEDVTKIFLDKKGKATVVEMIDAAAKRFGYSPRYAEAQKPASSLVGVGEAVWYPSNDDSREVGAFGYDEGFVSSITDNMATVFGEQYDVSALIPRSGKKRIGGAEKVTEMPAGRVGLTKSEKDSVATQLIAAARKLEQDPIKNRAGIEEYFQGKDRDRKAISDQSLDYAKKNGIPIKTYDGAMLYIETANQANNLYYKLTGKDIPGFEGQHTVGRGGVLFQTAPKEGTPEFKAWFGDSKVVDENGKASWAYHATGEDFQVFDIRMSGSTTDQGFHGRGFYFSAKPNIASDYADLYTKRPTVMPSYLRIENPYYWGEKSSGSVNALANGVVDSFPSELVTPVLDRAGYTVEQLKEYHSSVEFRVISGEIASALTDELVSRGYDGVVVNYNGKPIEYVAFTPEQIKSVFNRGTFDPNNPNILYQRGVTVNDLEVSDITPRRIGPYTVVKEVKHEGNTVAFMPAQFKDFKTIGTRDGNATMVGIPEDNPQARVYLTAKGEIKRTDAPERQPMQPTQRAMPLDNEQLMPVGPAQPGAVPSPFYSGMMTDEVASNHLRPMLGEMRKQYQEMVQNRPLKRADITPEAKKQLNGYMNGVKSDMAGTKLAATRFGEAQRDGALLNYSRRYNIDNYLNLIFPYQFWYTRSMINWGKRMIDKPKWFGMYYRLREAQRRNEDKGIPTRLRGKMRIPAAFLPDWMGDSVYVDPSRYLLPYTTFMQPFQQAQMNESKLVQEATGSIRKMAEGGQISRKEADIAIQTHMGAAWDKAYTEAQMALRDQVGDPMSLASMIMQPGMYITTPYYALTGQKDKIGTLPMTRMGQGMESTFEGTPLAGVGTAFAAPERAIRRAAGISEFGEWGDYYIDRQLANMVADGEITTQAAKQAMIERQGGAYQSAYNRVKRELALRQPGTLLAESIKGKGTAAQVSTALLFSLFPSGLLPEGELKLRNLSKVYNKAWQDYKNGDDEALSDFFLENPEYEARLALYDEPEDRLRSFLVNEIWDNYSKLDKANRRKAAEQLGDDFLTMFLSTDTRDYTAIDPETLAYWGQALGGVVPMTDETAAVAKMPEYMRQQVELYPPAMTKTINTYTATKDDLFPMISAIQDGYYAIPESDRAQRKAYLNQFPSLKKYWDWKRQYAEEYPEIVPYFDELKQRAMEPEGGIDVEPEQYQQQIFGMMAQEFSPELNYLMVGWVYGDQPLGTGARAELSDVWERYGKPYGDFDTFLEKIKE